VERNASDDDLRRAYRQLALRFHPDKNSELEAAGSLVGASDHGTTKSLYARDPDGLELEVVWIVPAALLDDDARRAKGGVRPLDLAAEIARYGARTPGGIGISRPAGS
jgi:hypothetical protein